MLSFLSKTTLPTCLYREGDGPAGRVGPEERRIMRKLVYTGFMSLDGVVDSPGGGPGEEHRSGGWVFKDLEFVEEAWSLKGEELADTTALMFGRRSYEAFASVWPGSQDHADYRDLPKYVVSSTLPEDALTDGWGPTTVLRSTGDVAALKEGEGGAVYIHGSAELARRLSDAGLIDQYNLLMFPVLLGAGKSLFGRADRDKQMLALRESETYSNGIVKLVYDVRR
ncbi:dihydrofolate reductase [Streptomyces albogriseolus]|uniref:Dihydrofolate reductase n=1 Tax=Streptomyces albogriseolus TaxID=1887 RepID=A0ACC6UXX6_STRAO